MTSNGQSRENLDVPDENESQRLVSLLKANWDDVHEEILANPAVAQGSRDALARLGKTRRFRGVTDVNAIVHGITSDAFEIARRLSTPHGDGPVKRRVQATEFTVFRSEDASVRTERRKDGSYLIRVSDTFLANIGFMLELLQASERGRSESDQVAVMTAIRFHVLSKCVFDSSMAVGFKQARPSGTSLMAAQVFVFAHELGHIALGHLEPEFSTGDPQVALEREADDFGLQLTHLATLLFRGRRARNEVALGVRSVLLLIEMRQLGLWIRVPGTHDPYEERITSRLAPSLSKSRSTMTQSFLAKIKLACDFSCFFPDEWWDGMLNDPRWLTSARPEADYIYVRHFDRVLGSSDERLLSVLNELDHGRPRDLADKVARVLSQPSRMCYFLLEDLSLPDANWLDASRGGLSRQEVLTAFRELPFWADERAARDLGAFVLMRLLQDTLREEVRT